VGSIRADLHTILGHDLRTPLGAIYTSANFLVETQDLQEPALTLTSRIARSATRTVGMVGDLLDFTRSRLGGGIPIVRAEATIGKVVHDVVDEIAAAHPGRKFDVETRGEQRGEWDCERISQATSSQTPRSTAPTEPRSRSTWRAPTRRW
jgi:K+-sensing histidine kinase KdpD